MNNKSIQVLRGKNNTDDEISAFNTAKANLLDGQPLFDKKNNYLYIGNKDDSSSIKPITSDRIKGDGYEISSDTDNLNITTTNDIKIQSGSDSSNPLVIETDSSNGLVKIKKENDDTTKSTAQLGVGFIHLPDISGEPLGQIPIFADGSMMNGIALGDDAFLFDCDAAGTIGIMQNNKTPSGQQPASTQTGLKFYERWDWNNNSESLNDKQSIEFTANYHDALLEVDRYNSLLAFCPDGREIQLGVRNSNADKFYLYYTSSTRGLWDSKLENRTGRPGSGAVVRVDSQDKVSVYADNLYGNLGGNADTATTATSADKIDGYHISVGQTVGSDTNTIYFITG